MKKKNEGNSLEEQLKILCRKEKRMATNILYKNVKGDEIAIKNGNKCYATRKTCMMQQS